MATEIIRNTTEEVTPDPRAERGWNLYLSKRQLIERAGPETFIVPSCSTSARYTVQYGGLEESCTCKDFEVRGVVCKHLIAVALMFAKRRHARHSCEVCGEPAGSISKGTGCPLIRDGGHWFHTSCKPVTRVEGL